MKGGRAFNEAMDIFLFIPRRFVAFHLLIYAASDLFALLVIRWDRFNKKVHMYICPVALFPLESRFEPLNVPTSEFFDVIIQICEIQFLWPCVQKYAFDKFSLLRVKCA